jgi:type 1 glutamine amidotransferase
VSWIRDWGAGRVFYCALGHREETYWNPVVMQHFLDGIQYTLGDLPADATPSARHVLPAAPAAQGVPASK